MFYQVVEIFKNVKTLHPMKRILNLFSRLGGRYQHLWVSPLWFRALQLILERLDNLYNIYIAQQAS